MCHMVMQLGTCTYIGLAIFLFFSKVFYIKMYFFYVCRWLNTAISPLRDNKFIHSWIHSFSVDWIQQEWTFISSFMEICGVTFSWKFGLENNIFVLLFWELLKWIFTDRTGFTLVTSLRTKRTKLDHLYPLDELAGRTDWTMIQHVPCELTV